MFQASFLYRPGTLDSEFHRVSGAVADEAAQMEGFLGEESWTCRDTGLCNAVYYWRDRPSLDAFVRAAAHRAAKRQQARWYDGYHVIISEIVATYGDGRLAHVTGDSRRKRPAP